MLELRVMDVCDGCPYFEARVDKYKQFGWYDKESSVDTIITCVHGEKCERIANILNEGSDETGDGQRGISW